ncbi:MAG: ATP-binding protein [Acidobacteria bacterium]|nr:ATP-binding protein [Acidobacteriota bacterium]
MGTIDGLVQFVRASDKARHWGQPTGTRLTALHVDERGTLWVATDRDLMRLVDGHLAVVPLARKQQPHQVESITSDFQGGVWLYDSEAGLLRWNGKQPRPVHLPAEVRQNRVSVTYTDSNGRVWVGFASGGIAVVGGEGQFHLYGTKDGLEAGVYLAICQDGDGTVWLGGTEGLSRFAKGKFVTVRRDNTFPADYVSAIVEDHSRSLWLGTRLGIVRIDKSEFDRALASPSYNAHYSLYDRSDGIAGMPVARSNNRRVIRANDGRLWFVTARGMTVIDPRALQATSVAGPVRIERVVADEQDLHQRPHITLAPGTRSLEIDYTVLDLTSPFKTRFRYRLEGFDRDWIEAGTRRQAFYTNLPSRPYRFRVVAKNNQGPWVETGASWDFSIRPMFYQTAGFYFASATALAFSLWLAWRFRIRQVRKQFTRLLGERVRLSREIHDTLLQGVVGLALQFDALAHDVDGPTPEKKQQFTRVRREIEEYIREARQAIWDLRSPKMHGRDLVQALREAGEHATVSNAISFEFNVSGTPKRCPPNLEEQLLKIGKEAIVNAVHHGQANRICVELQYDDASLTLQVSDDGLGFDPAHVANQGQTHYGLLSMKERAEEVGGGFSIASSIGRGTRVTAVVPMDGHA